MTTSLSDQHVRLLRTRAQLLTPSADSVTDVRAVVERVCGIQAQDSEAASLAIRVRSRELTGADVEQVLVHERSVVRTWALRGTLHLLATDDLQWLLPLLGPHFIRADARRRRQLGLDEATCGRALHEIRHVLANRGPCTRAELARHLVDRGLPGEGQAVPHLLSRAALEGILCLGPEHAGKATYTLLRDWVDQGHLVQERVYAASDATRTAAHTELVKRYLRAFGPATPDDMSAWSGLPISKTRAAWERIPAMLTEVTIAGRPAWMLKEQARLDDPLAKPTRDGVAARPVVRLLPSFDTYLLGYRSRELVVDPRHTRRIHPGGGVLRPAVLVDGKAVGTWRIDRRKKAAAAHRLLNVIVVVEPFEPLDEELHAGLEEEVQSIARFGAAQTIRAGGELTWEFDQGDGS